MKSSRNSF